MTMIITVAQEFALNQQTIGFFSTKKVVRFLAVFIFAAKTSADLFTVATLV
jgi:hypothetical protein